MTVNELTEATRGSLLSDRSVLMAATVMRLVPGLCVWAGVQVKMPLVSMFAPAGGLTRA